MLIDPKKVQFESKNDVIDYVTRGFIPPRREHFKQVMDKVKNPDPAGSNQSEKWGNEVTISEEKISEKEREELGDILPKVYENRVRNRTKFLIGSGVALLSAIAFSRSRKK